jgi:preprotein translocase subunit SecG
LIYVLYTLFALSCVVLIISVLLQPGKSGAGDLFTSSVSSTAFGPRGTQTLLAKITVAAAAVFMLVALTISFGVGRPRSVMESQSADTPEQTQPSPAAPAAPPQGDANATPASGQPDTTGANANTADTPAGTSASPQTQASP